MIDWKSRITDEDRAIMGAYHMLSETWGDLPASIREDLRDKALSGAQDHLTFTQIIPLVRENFADFPPREGYEREWDVAALFRFMVEPYIEKSNLVEVMATSFASEHKIHLSSPLGECVTFFRRYLSGEYKDGL